MGWITNLLVKFVILSIDDLERRTQVPTEFSEQELELPVPRDSWCAMAENMQLFAAVLKNGKAVKRRHVVINSLPCRLFGNEITPS